MTRRASSAGIRPRRRIRAARDSPSISTHDEVDDAVPLADIVDRHDVWVGQTGGGLRLAREALTDLALKGKFRRQGLHRDTSMQALVAGAIDHTHPPAPNLAFDRVRIP